MSVQTAGARELLEAARIAISAEGAALDGWSRSAAHLSRQALELGLDQFWRARAPGLADVSRRAQFICLPSYLRDPIVGRRAAFTWYALSQACHHHTYELSPTAKELRHWAESVEALLQAFHSALA